MLKLQILHPVQTITKCTQNIQFQNSFLVRLSFLWPNSDQKTTQLASKQVFWENSLERVGQRQAVEESVQPMYVLNCIVNNSI